MIGGNASAEGGAEDVDATVESGCNIVIANRLQPTTKYDKSAYQKHIKVSIHVIQNYMYRSPVCVCVCVYLCHAPAGNVRPGRDVGKGKGRRRVHRGGVGQACTVTQQLALFPGLREWAEEKAWGLLRVHVLFSV